MGSFFSRWSKRRGTSRCSSDTARDYATKYKEAPQASSESDDPPPYSTKCQGAGDIRRMASEPPRSCHSHVSTLPKGTSTLPLDDRYKDQNFPKRSLRKRRSMEDALETLKKYDTVLVVDDSGSMQGHRWEEAKQALSELASIAAEYDSDGLDIHFLNHSKAGLGIKNSATVNALFDKVQPKGPTPIGGKLDVLLSEYIWRLELVQRKHDLGNTSALKQIKPVNFIIITDGVPSDDPESVIVATARRLDLGHFPLFQVGIQFVQIGNAKKATAFLRELDDALSCKYSIRDMVDTTPYLNAKLTSEMLIKILIGGINRRVDHRGAEAVMDLRG
ncbi:hypothetical protein SCLCIDRAFT_1219002 [Scleroderma citrinum Foug A]|uniref:VWFA domain-containing protein n=1 Tax=Scleroderma citrinum Foug A TaxID=1036808 RepID=A0A0C3DB38_9AGAM|nr:hypothetical protein SCLCIDRAFT_1219002 [Scleroderma citrinum Foug A]